MKRRIGVALATLAAALLVAGAPPAHAEEVCVEAHVAGQHVGPHCVPIP